MSYTTYIEQALNKDTKTCTKCGLDKPLADYPENKGKYHSWCRPCFNNQQVHCGACHTKRPERDMIYIVRDEDKCEGECIGKYYCDQKCLTRMRCG